MTDFHDGYALVIGIARYTNITPLPATVLQDARDLEQLLRSPLHGGYVAANVRLLLDEQATAAGIRQGMQWLVESAGQSTTALIFFSGHGGRIEQGPQAGNYLIPYDCDPAHLAETAISGEELTALLRNVKAQRLLVCFDSCYSGGVAEAKGPGLGLAGFKSGLSESYYERLAQGSGRVIMASSRSDEVSLVLPTMKNSLFTHFLLQALRGYARTRGDGLIRIFDLFDYVSEQVPAHGPQHPIFKAADLENNFPIALHLGGKQLAIGADLDVQATTTVDKVALRQALVEHFSLEELDTLCADIEQEVVKDGFAVRVSLDEIGGGNSITAKARELIRFMERRGLLTYLEMVMRRERPGSI